MFDLQLLSRTVVAGPKALAIGSVVPTIGLATYWAKGAAELVVLVITLVPFVAAIGAAVGVILCPVVQAVVGLLRIRPEFWPVTHALLVLVLVLLAVLPYAVWIAGGVERALQGQQGVNLVFVVAAAAGFISGALFGYDMQRYAEKLRPD
jgi:hypothetical protein